MGGKHKMNQDMKDYIRRTWPAHLGALIPQIILVALDRNSILNSMGIILFVYILIFIIYLIIFGIKQKDGTRKRFKTIDKLMKYLGVD